MLNNDVILNWLRLMDTLWGEVTLPKIVYLPSKKRVYSKRKDWAQLGSKFFPFIEDSFLEEFDMQ